MSSHPPVPPDPPVPAAVGSVGAHPDQADAAIDLRKIWIVGIVSALIFAVGIGWAYWLLAGDDPDLRGPGSTEGARRLGASEIGIVDQVPFYGDPRLETLRASERQRLETWGWVDRGRGIIHIPIDEAMRRASQAQGGGQR